MTIPIGALTTLDFLDIANGARLMPVRWRGILVLANSPEHLPPDWPGLIHRVPLVCEPISP